MKVKFKLKSSKTASPVLEHVPKEIVEEEHFGSNLETVEKDVENKSVPKVVVEIVQILEESSNLSTAGIYRVSGKTKVEIKTVLQLKVDSQLNFNFQLKKTQKLIFN